MLIIFRTPALRRTDIGRRHAPTTLVLTVLELTSRETFIFTGMVSLPQGHKIRISSKQGTI
jgi:hypothetical protein